MYKHVRNVNDKNSYVDNDKLISTARNPEIKTMMEEIEDMLGRPLKVSEKKIILGSTNIKLNHI